MDLVLAEYSFVTGVLWPQWLSRWRKMGEVRGFRIWTHLLKGANRVMAWCWKYTFWNIVCIRFQSISIKGNHWIISWGALRSHSILILTIAVILGSRRSYHRRLRINKCSNISYCASFRRFHIGGQKRLRRFPALIMKIVSTAYPFIFLMFFIRLIFLIEFRTMFFVLIMKKLLGEHLSCDHTMQSNITKNTFINKILLMLLGDHIL